MSNVNATAAAAASGGARGKIDSSYSDGKLRSMTSTYTSVASEEPQVADTITWGTLPAGARIHGNLSSLNYSIGNAGMTLTLGDVDDDNFILAATDVGTAAGVTTLPLVNADGEVYVTDEPLTIISTIAVDEMLAGQVITLTIVYTAD